MSVYKSIYDDDTIDFYDDVEREVIMLLDGRTPDWTVNLDELWSFCQECFVEGWSARRVAKVWVRRNDEDCACDCGYGAEVEFRSPTPVVRRGPSGSRVHVNPSWYVTAEDKIEPSVRSERKKREKRWKQLSN